jgi:mono/diheme cytochrome c family protein
LQQDPFKFSGMRKIHLLSIACFTVLLTACGSNNEKTGGQGDNAAKPVAATGESIYNRTCVACHQANGAGVPNTFPPLAKSDYLADKEKVIAQVIKGSSGEITVNGNKYNSTMPPQQLTDEEVATVLTYVYGSFGNSGGTVTPDEVKSVRGKQ